MGTTAQKLEYLNGTKTAIKNAINQEGEVVTSSTTFRNYATGINTLVDTLKSYIPHTSTSGNPVSVNNAVALKPKVLEVDGDSKQNGIIYDLPSGYTQVDYIESDGNQYIELPYGFDNTDEIEFRFKLKTITGDRYLIAPKVWNDKNGNKFAMGGGNPEIFGYGYGSDGTSTTNYGISKETNNFHIERYSNYIFSFDNIIFRDVSGKSFGGETQNLKLFYGYGSNTSGIISYFKQKKSGSLVLELIPCFRNSDNEIGFYDLVNDVFYTNAGTGSFTYGSIATPSPDNEVPINTVKSSGGILTLAKNSKNFWNPIKVVSDSNNSSTYITEDGKWIRFSTGGVTLKFYPQTNSKTQYTFTAIVKGTTTTSNSITFKAFYKDGTSAALASISNLTDTNEHTIIGVTAPTKTLDYIESAWTSNRECFIKIEGTQLEVGSRSTEYEPYEPYKHDTIPFNIGNTEFASLPNGVKDKLWVNLRTGQYGKTGYVGEKIYDGSSSDGIWDFRNSWSGEKYRVQVSLPNSKNNGGLLSNYFKRDTGYNAGTINTAYIYGDGYLWFYLDSSFSSVDIWKTWLSTHNTIVKYELATPVTTTLGTLSQENLAKLVMYAGVNNINISGYDDNGAEPIIELDYYTEVQ